jgi:hypothetical protein
MLFELDLCLKREHDTSDLQQRIMQEIESESMTPLYQHLCQKYSWVVDDSIVERMK